MDQTMLNAKLRENKLGAPESLANLLNIRANLPRHTTDTGFTGAFSYANEIRNYIPGDHFEKEDRLQELYKSIGGIYAEISRVSVDRGNGISDDEELFAVIRKNIFTDPRKQIDLYENVIAR